MLFNFSLLTIDQTPHWGGSMHWFGLTDGCYWLEVGETTLLEYRDVGQASGSSNYCDYYVVRLWEDLIDIVPTITEPVPEDLIKYISGESAKVWDAKSSNWFADVDKELQDDRFWEIGDWSSPWIGSRILDTGYLYPSANIRMWSDEKSVHIDWDNSDKFRDGNNVWTAIKGSYLMSQKDFMEEVHSFHDRFMHEMAERVRQVASGGLDPKIKFDLPAMQKKHLERCRRIERATIGSTEPTDWHKVREAIREIERGPYGLNIIEH